MTWRVKLRAQKDAQKQLARTSLNNSLVLNCFIELTSKKKKRNIILSEPLIWHHLSSEMHHLFSAGTMA